MGTARDVRVAKSPHLSFTKAAAAQDAGKKYIPPGSIFFLKPFFGGDLLFSDNFFGCRAGCSCWCLGIAGRWCCQGGAQGAGADWSTRPTTSLARLPAPH